MMRDTSLALNNQGGKETENSTQIPLRFHFHNDCFNDNATNITIANTISPSHCLPRALLPGGLFHGYQPGLRASERLLLDFGSL